MFRYSFKNKGSFFGLFFLVYIAIATFSCFGTLNTSLLNTYDSLTEEYNAHNVVINELYDSNNYDQNQSRFKTWLASQPNFGYRNFDAFDVTTNQNSYKMVNYSNQYQIDQLDMFQNPTDTKWILDSVFHPYSLNDIAYQAQINQSQLIQVTQNQSMADFVKSNYINQAAHNSWYQLDSATASKVSPDSQLWFGMYQNLDQDLVIDAYYIKDNQPVAYRNNIITINKQDFKSFDQLTLGDYSDNFAWKYSPNSLYDTPEQKALDKLSINLIPTNLIVPDTSNKNETISQADFNKLQANNDQAVNDYLDKPLSSTIQPLTWAQIGHGLSEASTTFDVLKFLITQADVTNIQVFPAKQNYASFPSVDNDVDFLFTVKNNAKLTTYILPNVMKDKQLMARQNLFSFAANATWSADDDQKIKNSFVNLQNFTHDNPIFDIAWIINPNISNYLKNSPMGQGLDDAKVKYEAFSSPYNGVNAWVNNKGPNAAGVNLLINDFKIAFDLSNSLAAISGVFTDPTAYGAVVSPTWLEKNHKEVLPKEEWNRFLASVGGSVPLETKIKDFDSKYIVQIAATPYLILSTGITPDFMYPIISFENMVPNPDTQAIVYVGETGYARCFEAFQNNPREQFILGKYTGSQALSSYVSQLNQEIVQGNFMSWPKGTNAAFTYDSPDNQITPATLRVTFTSSLIRAVNGFTIAICVFIGLIALFVITILIRQFVVKNRQTLGIMNANGMGKFKIIYALSTLGLIPAILGGLIGYLVGFFTNSFALNLFKTYWLLPVNLSGFSIVFMVLAILIPLILFVSLTLIIGAFSLRGAATTLLSKTQTIKVGAFGRMVNKSISKTPIMLRFRTSVIFSTFYRLLVLSLMTSLVVVSTEFMASSLNSFSVTNQISAREEEYKFGVDLFSPTYEGGEYYAMSAINAGKPFLKPDGSQGLANGQYKTEYKNLPYLREYSNVHYPSIEDQTLQAQSLSYLNLKTQVRELINFKMGTSNPWEFAQNMMPSNQANQAINSSKLINEMLMSDTRLLSWKMFFQQNENGDITGLTNLGSITPTNLNDLVGSQHICTPGLKLIDDQTDSMKPIHIINFNDDQQLNYAENPMDLSIDIHDLNLGPTGDYSHNLAGFLNLNKDAIFQAINNYYIGGWITNNKLGITGIFKPNLDYRQVQLQVSPTNPNVIDMTFGNLNPNDILQVPNVLTNRTLFAGYFYEAHKKNAYPNDWDKVLIQNTNNWYADPFTVGSENPIYYSAINSTMVRTLKLAPGYIDYVLHYFNDHIYAPKIFRITYGLIGVDGDETQIADEPYVYVNGLIKKLNSHLVTGPLTPYVADNSIQLVGIVPDSQYIHLYDAHNHELNSLIKTWKKTDPIPVVINEFAAKKYNLNVGSVFNIEPSNTMDRFGKQLNSSYVSVIAQNALNKLPIKVVGISQSFHNAYAYIPIAAARSLIGLGQDDPQATPGVTTPYYSHFNGIFSSSPAPYLLTNTVALYSPNGMYPGTSTWQPLNNVATNLINTVLKSKDTSNPNYVLLNNALGSRYNNNVDQIEKLKKQAGYTDITKDVPVTLTQEIASTLANTYGATTYQSMVMNVMAIDNADALYASLSSTVITLETTILTLIFIIALIVIIIMLWMFLMDLIPLLALLSTMGLSIWSNSLTFMCILIPTWVISALISAPIVYALLNTFKEFVFKGIGILLLAPFNWWAYALIMGSIGLIFGLVYVLGAHTLSKVDITNAIKR